MSKESRFPLDAVWLMGLMWLLFVIELLLPFNFNSLALSPRRLSSLPSIVTFNLLHHGLWHIIANSLPFVVLGSAIQLYGRGTYWFATIVIALVGGMGTWLMASDGLVAGASGLVFGYWSFLLSSAYFRKSVKAFVIAFAVFIFYGTMLIGLLDLRAHISWSGHFWGMIGGVVAAYWSFANQRKVSTDSELL